MSAQLQRLFSDTEEQLLMMSQVFMDSTDPINIEDLDGTILEVNHEAIVVYGGSREEMWA